MTLFCVVLFPAKGFSKKWISDAKVLALSEELEAEEKVVAALGDIRHILRKISFRINRIAKSIKEAEDIFEKVKYILTDERYSDFVGALSINDIGPVYLNNVQLDNDEVRILIWIIIEINKEFTDESVEILGFINCHINELPQEIGQLVGVKILDFSDNHITKLPVEIGNLKSLKILTLNQNRLTELPSEIGKLEKLESLRLRGNPGNNHGLFILPKILRII